MHPAHVSPLTRFFAGLAEFTFQTQLGVADPPLIDYISDLLTRFTRNDSLYRVRDPRGRPLTEVAELMVEADQRIGSSRREVHRHVGDFALFWIGVYPEAVERRSTTQSKDCLIDYTSQGKRAYLIASSIDSENDQTAPGEVLERLSQSFEMCAYGLREVRREWERREGDDPQVQPLIFG
jgi:hypothetical protein